MSQTLDRNDCSDNKIELRTVNGLCGMNFYIPNYQRGYRWTKQQVKDLLNDINEFNDKDGFYCLQPLVVKRREKDVFRKIKEEAQNINDVYNYLKGISWEVIDGQQRLTTIFILMKCLGIVDKHYALNYETRGKSKEFLDGNLETNESNIDYFHISQANHTIRIWLDNLKNKDYQSIEKFKEKLLNKVNFIWYESVDEDPIKVFTRLNIGKISLTNSELIKALFLNRSNFDVKTNGDIKLRQQEIASEWDKIEYTLQNDEFWLFLHKKGYDRPTRIDFIFDLICEANDLGLNDYKEKIGTDEYKTFRYFYEYFKSDISAEECNNSPKEESKIAKCWKTVKRYYQTFEEWYNDLELFHYIGFLIDCKGNSLIKNLLREWNQQGAKVIFLQYLKREVKKILNGCPSSTSPHEEDGDDKKEIYPQLRYQYREDGSNKRECKPILLFHNIQTVIDQNKSQKNNEKYEMGTFYKFPFHLYKLESWDVEHINSNTTNPEEDVESQREWLLNIYLSVNEELQKKIKEHFNSSSEDNKTLFEEIKKEVAFSNVEWTQKEKNRIWNYALLDSSTNRSYGNSIFSGKRRIIIGKDKGKLIAIPQLSKDGKLVMTDEQNSTSSFVPPCTRQVFLKYYSATAGNNNYWTKEDAQYYLNDIESCIKKLEE